MAAWSFDRAVYLFGTSVEADLREAADGAKNKGQSASKQMAVMAKWMGRKMQYRDPAGQASSKTTEVAVDDSSGPVSL